MSDDLPPPEPPKPPSVFDAEYERRRSDPVQYNPEKKQFRCLHKDSDGNQCKFFEKPDIGYCPQHDQKIVPPVIVRHLKSVPEPGKTVSLRKPKATDPPTTEDSTNPRQWKVQCTGVTANDTRCTKWAVKGLHRCSDHGANDPAVREMGKRVMDERIERYEMTRLANKYGIDPVENPLLALQGLATEILLFKEFAREQVARIEVTELTYTDRALVEQVRACVQLYERAMDRAGRVLADMARINIDERLAQITERQAEVTATVVENVLRRLDMGDRVQEARNMLGQEFKSLHSA